MSRRHQPSGFVFVRFRFGGDGDLQIGILRRTGIEIPEAVQMVLLISGRYAPGPFVKEEPQVDDWVILRGM